ncbi:MAG TPA: peptidylprolyl isomerase [Anaerohalosphaeraceae bacterium]|jgi:parvulin-like peptidyl-prolyl isomerase|nr:peptidylprolyl isomerase [Anaerohalosphaeraceae bacterium]HQG06086.1 peptidylprolyl isomerase [Anaerohalosphaeraceae bacterium]HQI07499.1 peptidylprolyl isomerase [Anaerohalosphaeraceae bacterium]HQJ67795.1 peptidylprolyl isomerase [Anaerohalosphaeraceae bacterium]
MVQNSRSVRGIFQLAAAGLVVFLSACSSKIPQGKYSQEEMLNLPLANRYNLPEPTGGMVLKVGSETLTSEEILSIPQVKEALTPLAKKGDLTAYEAQAMPLLRSIIRSKAADLLLYEEARKSAPANIDELLEAAVKKEIERFVADYDNNVALAEQELKRMGMDWQSFRDFQKKLIMTQSYISSTVMEERKFTRSELMEYYERVKNEQFFRPGRLQFQLIELVPAKLSPQQLLEGETPQQAARRIADELLQKLQQGEDFAELAKQFSHDPLASAGGLWAPVTLGTDSLAEPYDKIEKIAEKMQVGEIKGPVEEGGRIFIIRLVSFTPPVSKSFDEVQHILESQLQFQYKNRKYNELVEKVLKRADFVELERFAEFCAQEAYRRWSK